MDLLEKKDNEIQNPFFKDLVTIMSNPQFRQFYNTYFTDWNEIESMVFFMKLYSTIEYEYQQRFNLRISEKEMASILANVMQNNVTRQYALDLFKEFKSTVDYKKTKRFRSLLAFNEPLAITLAESDPRS